MEDENLLTLKAFNLMHPPSNKMIVKISSDFKSIIISDVHEQFIFEDLGKYNR